LLGKRYACILPCRNNHPHIFFKRCDAYIVIQAHHACNLIISPGHYPAWFGDFDLYMQQQLKLEKALSGKAI
jgi:endonuclease/exonuclease/phosphatase (EEP) superfamily protein YafD